MISLLVADDHTVLRQALCELLQKGANFDVIAQASDGAQVLEILKTQKPDLIIMDISMPRVDGIEALKQLKERGDSPPVLILTANSGEHTVRAALDAGAKGFIPKNAGTDELEFAISSIMKGQTYLSPSITDQMIGGRTNGQPGGNPISILTKREIEILKLLADGRSNKEIGKQLFISSRTVDTHRSNILKKLKAKNNQELVKIAIHAGLVSI
ncbi:MAG: response regulator transcription factor [bacterium]|nr:response regulator transcription factor [bacterium]